MNVFCLGQEQIDNLWPLYGCHLDRYEREIGTDYAEDIRSDLKAGTKQLWGLQCGPSIVGVVVTRVAQSPRGSVCEIYIACGESHGGLFLVLDEIERWAKSVGCSRVRLSGRKGWLRVLKQYEQTGIQMEKEL